MQPRVPTGKYNLAELPAGMLDDSGDFIGIAAKELQEETGIMVRTRRTLEPLAWHWSHWSGRLVALHYSASQPLDCRVCHPRSAT